MKLFKFRVEISTDILVLAETREQAREIARDNAEDALYDEEAFVDSGYEVKSRHVLPMGWHETSLPFRDDGDVSADISVGDYFDRVDEQAREAEAAARQLSLLPTAEDGEKKS